MPLLAPSPTGSPVSTSSRAQRRNPAWHCGGMRPASLRS